MTKSSSVTKSLICLLRPIICNVLFIPNEKLSCTVLRLFCPTGEATEMFTPAAALRFTWTRCALSWTRASWRGRWPHSRRGLQVMCPNDTTGLTEVMQSLVPVHDKAKVFYGQDLN